MIFAHDIIEKKQHQLDSVLAFPDLIESVVAHHQKGPFTLVPIPRPWSPGGGSTLFRIETCNGHLFLKIKHREVLVESRLESEATFSPLSSLKNEAHFLEVLTSPDVPALCFYEEQDDYCFLATEWLEPFREGVAHLSLDQLMSSWRQLNNFCKQLFARGIVHTDLHEGNLCFRNGQLVVCDFEEARYLAQDLSFERSLDVCGENAYGNVGSFPAETGVGPPGLTCLHRLKGVFFSLIRNKLRTHLTECNFDQECPFNLDALQQPDDRIYQSIDLAGVRIAGHRPGKDLRKGILNYFLLRAALRLGRPVRHHDLGCNIGMFCLSAASSPWVASSLGLEAFVPYVVAARALMFLSSRECCEFQEFICGRDRLSAVADGQPADLCTMLSVYHHVAARDAFLDDLAGCRPKWLLAEFADQARYYPQRGSLPGEIEYIRSRLGYRLAETIMLSPDYRRPLVFFSDRPLSILDRGLLKLLKLGGGARLFDWLIRKAGPALAALVGITRRKRR